MFVSWRDLRFAKGRFALMGTVVVLITLLVVMLSGLTAGLGRASTSAITGLSADHLVFSAPAEGQGISFTESSIDAATLAAWAEVAGVRRAEPLGISTVKAIAQDRSAALSAFAVDPGSDLAPDGDEVAAGQVVLSTGAAKALDVSKGQRVTVAGRELTVAKISGDATYSHTPVMWTAMTDWERLTPGVADATVIALDTDGSTDLAATDERLQTKTVSLGDSLSAISSYNAENSSLQLMRMMLFAISALVIGAFFTVWTIQRSGDVAVLKALGARTSYLLGDALGQALVLLGVGTTVGTALAVAAGSFAGDSVPFVLEINTMLVPAVIMILLGMAGAALSIRRITSVDPLTALGSTR